jgi:glycosyltransferase involved in cell wall biosynthesis
MSAPYVSVIVPIRDNLHGLEFTVRSLAAQDLPLDEWEVIVVDDGSAVPAAGAAEPFGLANLQVVRLYPGVGRSKGRNHGIRSARGEVVLMLDGDSFAAPDLVRRHAEFHRNLDPEAPRVLLSNQFEPSWATVNRLIDGDVAVPKNAIEQDRRQSMFGVEASAISRSRIPWAYFFTHALSVRRQDLEAVGGFDEEFEGWGLEDVDLGYRLFEAAGRPDSLFMQDPRAYTFAVPHYRDFRRQSAEEQHNMEIFRRKHPRYDVELFYGSGTYTDAKVAYYEGVLDSFRSETVGELQTSDLAAAIDSSSSVLLIGGTPPPARLGRTVTWNHRAPADSDNLHLFGLWTPFKDAEFDDVVHVDLWRFLIPEDLLLLIAESLRIATRLRLISTALSRPGPERRECDMDFLLRMLDGRLRLALSEIQTGQIITIER